jgi:hypothetical protein
MRKLIITAKCSDLCQTIYVVDGTTKAKHDGYPLEIEGLSSGDYINLEIDLDTGLIVNWKVPSHSDVMTEFDIEEED